MQTKSGWRHCFWLFAELFLADNDTRIWDLLFSVGNNPKPQSYDILNCLTLLYQHEGWIKNFHLVKFHEGLSITKVRASEPILLQIWSPLV